MLRRRRQVCLATVERSTAMRVFTEHVGAGSAILTGYVLDHSDELLNARIRPAVLDFRAAATS
jgi:hypothetical protein